MMERTGNGNFVFISYHSHKMPSNYNYSIKPLFKSVQYIYMKPTVVIDNGTGFA